MTERPFPPGEYPIVVVGSGPGGLQTSYSLSRLGVEHAVLSADEAPGGMFRTLPIFGRLLSWTKPEAPADPATPEYEWFDHNSLLGEEPAHRAAIRDLMDRSFAVPTREEMEAGLARFAERGGVRVRYGCRWEATRREPDGALTLVTTEGEYRCRAAVFAVGVTDPWKSAIAGIEDVPHYVDTRPPREYEGKRVLVVGKRNSGFEIADGLLPWARQVILVSPRPVQTSVLALTSVRVRYMQPLEDSGLGGGTLALDAAVDRVERTSGGIRLLAHGTTRPGELTLEADEAIAATGFATPLRDLEGLGVATVAQGRIPALTPWWESVTAPGIFFAGNATQGAAGPRKHGVVSSSAAVHGFRYNARVLARRLAEGLGAAIQRPVVHEPGGFLADVLAHAPEIWAQKGYLARVLRLGGEPREGGAEPLAAFLDEPGPDAVAATVEMNAGGEIYPVLYTRRGGDVQEHTLEAHPLHAFDGEEYRSRVETILRPFR